MVNNKLNGPFNQANVFKYIQFQFSPVIDQTLIEPLLYSTDVFKGFAQIVSDSKSYFTVWMDDIRFPPLATVVRLKILSCPENDKDDISNVAHEASEIDPVIPNAEALFAIIFPSEIVVFPVYVFVPPSVNVHAPNFNNHPVPLITELIIGEVDQLVVILVFVLLSVIVPPLNV